MPVWEDIRIMWDANSCRFGIAYRTQPAAGRVYVDVGRGRCRPPST